jgi:hypothetical protein
MSVLGRFDRDEIERRLDAAGLLAAVRARGFGDLAVSLDERDMGIPHIRLRAEKDGNRFLLLDACLSETVIHEGFFADRGVTLDRPVELIVVFWVREQDPTRPFRPERPPLPLQEHPGLGVLPLAFRVVRDMALDLGKDGVAAMPKFFHDACIFYRSRLFLFLDGGEQGRFERLLTDLSPLPLGHASLALLDGHVREGTGRPVIWSPGYQVCPLSERLTAYFNSGEYAARVDAGVEEFHYRCEAMNLLPATVAPQRGLPAAAGDDDAEELP